MGSDHTSRVILQNDIPFPAKAKGFLDAVTRCVDSNLEQLHADIGLH